MEQRINYILKWIIISFKKKKETVLTFYRIFLSNISKYNQSEFIILPFRKDILHIFYVIRL